MGITFYSYKYWLFLSGNLLCCALVLLPLWGMVDRLETKPFCCFCPLLKMNLFKEKSKKQERQRIIVFPQSLISLLLVMSTLFYCSFSMVFGESKLTLFLLIFHLINSLHSKSLDQLQLSFFFVSFCWFNGISKQFVFPVKKKKKKKKKS